MKASRPNWIYLTQEAKFEGWAGDIRQSDSLLPAYWTVDYVRYYRKNPQAPVITVAPAQPITAGQEDGKVIRVTLKNGRFTNSLHPGSWSLENLPSLVSLGAVQRIDDTHLELTLNGNSRPGWDSGACGFGGSGPWGPLSR